MRKDMLRLRHLLCAALVASTTGQAYGQSTANENEQAEIVVTGVRPGDEPIRDKAVAFVRKVSASPVDGQFARWHEPICPAVYGLSKDHASIVVRRIKEISKEVGAIIGRDNCSPNIVVTFTDNANNLMELLVKRRSTLLTEVAHDDRVKLVNSSLPVRWWYSTHTEGSDGHQISTNSAALLNMLDFPTPRSGKFLDSYNSTLIGTKLNVNLRTVSVVVDTNGATGSTLNSLSAYITMIALVPTKLTTDYNGLPSILAMFPITEKASHHGLTDWDQAYLTSVYKVPADRTARVQRSLIAGQMIKRMAK